MKTTFSTCLAIVVTALLIPTKPARAVDLLKRYPTQLTAGDARPNHARPWKFTEDDIFHISRFELKIDDKLKVETGPADAGIGHCADGAVWAVLIPRKSGTLTSPVVTNREVIEDIWLRFHPDRIDALFPPESVLGAGQVHLEDRMRTIAEFKFRSSWHAGNRAMIPEPKEMTVDVDVKGGPRRFFAVDTEARTAEYIAAFANQRPKPSGQAYQPELDTNCAQVVSVAPPNGATDVDPLQTLRIRFDRPMNPYHLKLEWLAGGFQLNGSIRVSSDRKEFIIPVRLTPGQEQKLAINRDPELEMWAAAGRTGTKPRRTSREGFLDADLVPANEYRWSFWTKPTAVEPGAGKPRVISVSPPSGSTTPVLTVVRITFDQPMRPPDVSFPYLEKRPFERSPSLIPSFGYDATTHCLSFPALLRPDDDTRLTLRGLYGADGVACDPVVLHYQSGTESLDPVYAARARAAAQDPKLRQLLASMKEARARLSSGVEMVQTIGLGLSKTSFDRMEAQTATFKWQGTNQVYADITGPMSMCRAFILGSDGQTCWLYSVSDKGEPRLERTPTVTTEQSILVADPFDLSSGPVQKVLAEEDMVYAGQATLEGRKCYRIEKWDVSQDPLAYATLTQWWIDERTFLPRQIVQYHPYGCNIVRFDYRNLNQSLPEKAFEPPVSAGAAAQPLFFKTGPAPGEQRFLRISDGSNGRMSGRIGWHGANGTTSSGLN